MGLYDYNTPATNSLYTYDASTLPQANQPESQLYTLNASVTVPNPQQTQATSGLYSYAVVEPQSATPVKTITEQPRRYVIDPAKLTPTPTAPPSALK